MHPFTVLLYGVVQKSFTGLKWPVHQPRNPSDWDVEDMDSSSENVIEETEVVEHTPDTGLLSRLENKMEEYIFYVEV